MLAGSSGFLPKRLPANDVEVEDLEKSNLNLGRAVSGSGACPGVLKLNDGGSESVSLAESAVDAIKIHKMTPPTEHVYTSVSEQT